MQSGLLVVGISHHTAPVEIRERFSICESRLYPSLHQLSRAPSIGEVVILSTCNRTEFILWCSDQRDASASLENFLAIEFPSQAKAHDAFYRFKDIDALTHLFRVASSLDSLVVGEPQIVGQFKTAWTKARQAGTAGRFLDRVFQKALSVSKHVRNETEVGNAPVSIPHAAVTLARRLFSSFDNRAVMLLGSGKMSELSARYLLSAGAKTIWVANRTYEHALDLARELGGTAVRYEDRLEFLAAADILLSSTGCPHVVLDRQEAERIRVLRNGRPFFLIDIAVPRDIDPSVREIPGFFLYDIDDLQQVVSVNLDGRKAAAAEAEKMVLNEAQSFAPRLEAERIVPTLVNLRAHLEQIRRTELARFQSEWRTMSTVEQQAAIDDLTARILDRVVGELAGELRQSLRKPEGEQLPAAIRRLFHLPEPGSPILPAVEQSEVPAGD